MSESSCCSNDTLFNLEELNSAPAEIEKKLDQPMVSNRKIDLIDNFNNLCDVSNTDLSNILNTTFLIEFESSDNKSEPPSIQNDSNKFLLNKMLHSKTIECNQGHDESCNDICPDSPKQNNELKDNSATSGNEITKVETTSLTKFEPTLPVQGLEETEIFSEIYDEDNYDAVNIDYSQYVNMENAKNNIECDDSRKESDPINIIETNMNNDDDNMYGMLADIRFSGPTDSQLMSTSFSESNTCDEKEWDSGSDSRSSSSGEFIWKVCYYRNSINIVVFLCRFKIFEMDRFCQKKPENLFALVIPNSFCLYLAEICVCKTTCLHKSCVYSLILQEIIKLIVF